MSRRSIDPKEIDQLPAEEIDRLLPYGLDAVVYGRIMYTAALLAFVVGVFGFAYSARGVVNFATACFIGFLIVGTVGTEVKFRHFRRLVAEAINARRNGTP